MRARKGRTRSAIGGQLCWCAGACVRVCVCGGGGSTTRIHPAGRPPPPTQPTYAPTHPPARPPTHHPPSHAVLCSSSTAAVQCSTTCLPLHGTGCPPPAGARAAPASRGGAPPLPPGAPPAPPDQQRMGGRGSSSVGRGRGGGGAARTTAHARLASTRPDTALAWRRCCSATSACARLRHSSCAARGRGGGGEKRVQAQGGARAPSPCPRTRLPTPLAPAPTPPPHPPISRARGGQSRSWLCPVASSAWRPRQAGPETPPPASPPANATPGSVRARTGGGSSPGARASRPPRLPLSPLPSDPPPVRACLLAHAMQLLCLGCHLALLLLGLPGVGGRVGGQVGGGGLGGERRQASGRVAAGGGKASACSTCHLQKSAPPPPPIPLGAHLQGVLTRLDPPPPLNPPGRSPAGRARAT